MYVIGTQSKLSLELGAGESAKPLFDLRVDERTGGTDRRTALDVQVLREEL